MKIEAGKFYKTKSGRKIRIYATNCTPDGQGYAIHGAIEYLGVWNLTSWQSNGRWDSRPHTNDIVSEWEEPKSRLLGYRHIMTGQVILSSQPEDTMQRENYERVPHLDEPST